MKRLAVVFLAAVAACGGTESIDTTTSNLENRADRGQPEPPMAGIHWARGQAKSHGGGSPDLLYHGGPVLTQQSGGAAAVTPIFWGIGWSSDGQNKKGWIDTFYKGMSSSSYESTNTEYTQSGGAHVGTSFSVNAGLTDLSAGPRNGNKTGPILAEVCKMISKPVANGYYPVYTDLPRGHAGFCAWHSAGTCNGVTVQFAFFFDLDGDPGCDPESPATSYSQGVAALANVSGHELSEALTDPHLNAWYDANGAENSDKCAWTFGAQLLSFTNRSQWKVQGNWSNSAYDGNRGYSDPARGFVRGCIDGTN